MPLRFPEQQDRLRDHKVQVPGNSRSRNGMMKIGHKTKNGHKTLVPVATPRAKAKVKARTAKERAKAKAWTQMATS